MVELEYFLVCRSIAVDIDSDDLTLCNVLEDVFPLYIPDFIDNVAAVSSWRFSADERKDYQAILKVTLPGEGEPAEFPMNFAEDRSRYRAIQTIRSVPIEAPGQLIFEVFLNGHRAATHHVTIHPPFSQGDNDRGASVAGTSTE
jgi:hypothetical protein